MQVIRQLAEIRAKVASLQAQGKRIALVPTMGFLHDGHLSLLREARGRADILVMSLFVNPTQFAPGEDLDLYPRDEEGDLAKAKSCGVDIVFCPDASDLYPDNFQTSISLEKLAAPMCGESRPIHFAGVATVVTKLFNLCQPQVAVFGQKDAQQLAILKQLVVDLNFDIEIVGCPIIREEDGLAMSSRNVRLSPSERKQARSLSRGLFGAKERFGSGVRDAKDLVSAARAVIAASPLAKIDYIEIRDAKTLAEVSTIDSPALMAVAVRFGQTRLIDNITLHTD